MLIVCWPTWGQAESAASALARELAARTAVERERREAHDAAQASSTAARLRDARLTSEFEALERDRRRSMDERAAAEAELDGFPARPRGAHPVARISSWKAVLGEAERELANALLELAGLRGVHQAHGQEQAALRRAAAAHQAEVETAQRRLAEAESRVAEESARAATARSAP